MNTAHLSGYLATEVETRTINDHVLCKFDLANHLGERTLFLTVEAWRMEHLAQHLHKGSQVLVTGHLRQNNWETKEGEKRSKIVLVASYVEYLDAKPRSAAPTTAEDPSDAPGPAPAAPARPAPGGRGFRGSSAPVPAGAANR